MSDLNTHYTLTDLFDQLGLPSSENDINRFLQTYCPLTENIEIWHAPWWNQSQADFLHHELKADANWQAAIEELNTRLRKSG